MVKLPIVRKSPSAMGLITEQFRKKTSARLQAAEIEAGGDEGALEALYRSSAWDDLSFALAAFPYWGAWIDLEIAKKTKDPGERAPWIWKAKKGFRSTSVQIFRPSLVYGGWLGLGYIASAEKKYDRALSIFESLKNALESEPDNPLYKVVSLELRLLQAREGQVDSTGVATSGKVDSQEAQLLRLEAFALLEKYRTSQEGGREAAARLKKLVTSGYVDMDFVAQVVNYRAEISAFDVGPWTHLAAAEYAFEYGHFFDAVQKFKRFFASVGNVPGVDLSRYRYRHALANYKAKLYDDAARIANSLARRGNLEADIKKASIKLAYAALSSRPGRGTRSQQRELQDGRISVRPVKFNGTACEQRPDDSTQGDRDSEPTFRGNLSYDHHRRDLHLAPTMRAEGVKTSELFGRADVRNIRSICSCMKQKRH